MSLVGLDRVEQERGKSREEKEQRHQSEASVWRMASGPLAGNLGA